MLGALFLILVLKKIALNTKLLFGSFLVAWYYSEIKRERALCGCIEAFFRRISNSHTF